MDTSLMLELHIFFTAIYGGIIGGFTYDMYKSMRYLLRPKKLMTYIGDFLFWTMLTWIFLYVLIKNNWGEIRGYIVFGFILGILIYSKGFSKFIYPLCIKIGGVVVNIINLCITAFLYPFKFLKSKTSFTLKKFKKVPIEIIRQIKKHKKIISTKK